MCIRDRSFAQLLDLPLVEPQLQAGEPAGDRVFGRAAFADPIVHGRAAAACRFVRITWTKMPSRLLVNQ